MSSIPPDEKFLYTLTVGTFKELVASTIKSELADLNKRIEALLQESEQPNPTETPPTDSPAARVKKSFNPITHLKVIMPDGTVEHHHNAADTLVTVISKIGLQRVADLNLTGSGICPLVSTENHVDYQQTPIDGFYVLTGTTTKQKAKQLRQIARNLQLKISVEVVRKYKT